MSIDLLHLDLQVNMVGGSHDEELTESAHQLRLELEEAGIDNIMNATIGEIPRGSKGLDPAIAGALAVTLASSVLPKLLEVVQAWVQRDKIRTVRIKTGKLEVEFTSDKPLTPEVIKKLVEDLAISTNVRKQK